MNLLEKLSAVRLELQRKALPKSGRNTFSNYDYYELSDFMPYANELMDHYKLAGLFSMDAEHATLRIVDAEKPDDTEIFTLPVREAVLKGAHPIQNLGAMITYLRRYIWMAALELVESDALDNSKPAKPPAGDENALAYRQKFDVAISYLKKAGKYDAEAVKALFKKDLGFENYQQITDEQLPAAKRVLKSLRTMAKANDA